MTLDLSSALRDAAEHAPLGAIEPLALSRRVRRRRAVRTAAHTTAGLGLAGAIAVTATQTPGFLDRHDRTPAGPALPPDQVASALPAADPEADPGECGWTVQHPPATSPYDLAVALGQYPQETYSSMPLQVSVRITDDVAPPAAIGVVAVRDEVVVAVAADDVEWGDAGPGPASMSGGAHLGLLTCGGADVSKALPDGDYEVYAVYAAAGTGDLVALSPAEPLVVGGNAREPWCGADASVIPGADGRTELSGDVTADGAVHLRVTWSGQETAEMVDQRVVLVDDATGRIVADSRAPSGEESWVNSALVPGETLAFSVTDLPDDCGDDEPLAPGTYRAIATVTVAPHAMDGLPTNALAVAELSGRVVVP